MATRNRRLDAAGRILDELHQPPDEAGVTLAQWLAGTEHVRAYLRGVFERGELPDEAGRADAITAGLIAAGADPDAARACAAKVQPLSKIAALASIMEAEARRVASSNPPAPAGPTGH